MNHISHFKNSRQYDYFTVEETGVNLTWQGLDYFIGWNEIDTPLKLLQRLAWICQQTCWKSTTPMRVGRLISAVIKNRGWA